MPRELEKTCTYAEKVVQSNIILNPSSSFKIVSVFSLVQCTPSHLSLLSTGIQGRVVQSPIKLTQD